MKKTLLTLAAVTMATSSVYASKARMTALGQNAEAGSSYLMDNRDIYGNPGKMAALGDYGAFEWGSTTVGSTPNAEGSMVKSVGGGKLGLTLGKATTASTYVTIANAALHPTATQTGFMAPQDVFEIGYAMDGSLKWGASIIYGNSDKKSTKTKASTAGLRLGAMNDMFDVGATIGLGSTAEGGTKVTSTTDSTLINDPTQDDNKLTGTTGVSINAAYNLGDGMTVFADMDQGGFKVENAGTKLLEVKQTDFELGFANVMPIESTSRFFYSVAYMMSNRTVTTTGDTKTETSSLPVTIGVEADATSWLVLRGSVKQSLLLNSTKTTPATGDATTDSHGANDTTVAAGAGLKLNKFMLDGTLAGSTTGALNANTLLANASLTYMF